MRKPRAQPGERGNAKKKVPEGRLVVKKTISDHENHTQHQHIDTYLRTHRQQQ